VAVETRKLDGSPGMPALYGRAALGALPGAGLLPFVGGRGSKLPDLQLELAGVEVEADRLAAYCRVCAFTLRDSLPPTYPHVLAFPLQMRLMADGSFPFPLLGLVHIDNAITQHRPIGAGERLDFAVRAEDLRPHPKGRAFSLIAEARVGGELVWEERGTILRRGGGDPDAPREPRPAALPDDAPATTEWRLGDDLGRRYAGVSGDRNPIHMHSLSAKAFGFPRAIAHGMWSQARCLAQLEGRLPGSFTTRASFGKPLLLPGRVTLAVADRDGGETGFALRDARKGTEHLLGDLQP
jgi:acyl dehydratase